MAGAPIQQGWNVRSDEPIDPRLIFANETARFAADPLLYQEGFVCAQVDNDTLYLLSNHNQISNANGWTAIGAANITVDSALSSTSTNPVENRVVNTGLAGKLNKPGGNPTAASVVQVDTAGNPTYVATSTLGGGGMGTGTPVRFIDELDTLSPGFEKTSTRINIDFTTSTAPTVSNTTTYGISITGPQGAGTGPQETSIFQFSGAAITRDVNAGRGEWEIDTTHTSWMTLFGPTIANHSNGSGTLSRTVNALGPIADVDLLAAGDNIDLEDDNGVLVINAEGGGGITAWSPTAGYEEGDEVDHQGGLFEALDTIPENTLTPPTVLPVLFVRFVDFTGVVYAHIRFTTGRVAGLDPYLIRYNFGGQERTIRFQGSNVISGSNSVGVNATPSNWFIPTTTFDSPTNSNLPDLANFPDRSDLFGFSVTSGPSFPAAGHLFDSHNVHVTEGGNPGNTAPGVDTANWRRLNRFVQANQNGSVGPHLSDVVIDGLPYRTRFRGNWNSALPYAADDLVVTPARDFFAVRSGQRVGAAGSVEAVPVTSAGFINFTADTTNSYLHLVMPTSVDPDGNTYRLSYDYLGQVFRVSFSGSDVRNISRTLLVGASNEFFIRYADVDDTDGDPIDMTSAGVGNNTVTGNFVDPQMTVGTGTPNLDPELDPTNWERISGSGILDPERFNFRPNQWVSWSEVEGTDIAGRTIDIFRFQTTPANLTIAANGDITTTGLPEATVTALTAGGNPRIIARTENSSSFFVSSVVSSTATSIVTRVVYFKSDSAELIGQAALNTVIGIAVGTNISMFASLEKITENHAGGLVIDIADTFNITRNDTDPGTPSQYAEITFDTDANSETFLQLVGALPGATTVTTNADHAFTITAAGGTATPFTFPAGTTFVDVGTGAVSVRFISETVRNIFAGDAEDTSDNGRIGSPQDDGNTTMAIELGTRVQKARAGDNVTITATGDEATISSSVPFGTDDTDVARWARGDQPIPSTGITVSNPALIFNDVEVIDNNTAEGGIYVLEFSSQAERDRFMTTTVGNTTGARPPYTVSLTRDGNMTATTDPGHTVIAAVRGLPLRAYIEFFRPLAEGYTPFNTAWGNPTGADLDAGTAGTIITITVGHQGVATGISAPGAELTNGILDLRTRLGSVSLNTTTPATFGPNTLVVTQNSVRGQRIGDSSAVTSGQFARSMVTGGATTTLDNQEGIYEAGFEDLVASTDVPRVVENELYFFRSRYNFSTMRRYAAFTATALANFAVDTSGSHLLLNDTLGTPIGLPTGVETEVFLELTGTDTDGRTQSFVFRAGDLVRYRTNDLAVSVENILDPDNDFEPFASEFSHFSGRVYDTDIEVLESDPQIEFSVLGDAIHRNATAAPSTQAGFEGQGRESWGWHFDDMNLPAGTTNRAINTLFEDLVEFEYFGSQTADIYYIYNGTDNQTNVLAPLTTAAELLSVQTGPPAVPTASIVVINDDYEQISIQGVTDVTNPGPVDGQAVIGTSTDPVSNKTALIRGVFQRTHRPETLAEYNALVLADGDIVMPSEDIAIGTSAATIDFTLDADFNPVAATTDTFIGFRFAGFPTSPGFIGPAGGGDTFLEQNAAGQPTSTIIIGWFANSTQATNSWEFTVGTAQLGILPTATNVADGTVHMTNLLATLNENPAEAPHSIALGTNFTAVRTGPLRGQLRSTVSVTAGVQTWLAQGIDTGKPSGFGGLSQTNRGQNILGSTAQTLSRGAAYVYNATTGQLEYIGLVNAGNSRSTVIV